MFRLGTIISLLGLTLGLAAASLADELLELRVQPDGSADPPGDRLAMRVLVSPKPGELKLEVRAFEIAGEGAEAKLSTIGAKQNRNRDDKGQFLLSTVVPPRVDGLAADVSMTIPFADLRLNVGIHRMGYRVRGTREGQIEFDRATPVRRVRLTEEPRLQMAKHVERSVAEAVVTHNTGILLRNGAQESFQYDTTREVRRSVSEVREVRVNIDNGFVTEARAAFVDDERDPIDRERERLADVVGVSAADVRTPKERTVYFATTRNLVNRMDRTLARFGNDFASGLRYGSCLVNVPLEANHRRGQLERPTFWHPYDPEKHFAVEATASMDGPEPFYQLLGARLRGDANNNGKDLLLSVHGYNNTMEFAMLRLAQVAYDIEFPGTPMLFSWPSQGSVRKYGQDEDMAQQSESSLADVLLQLIVEQRKDAARTKGRIHIVAHSLGNRLFLRALTQLKGRLRADAKSLGHVILAAPDVDAPEFVKLVPWLMEQAESVTLYSCRDDLALIASHEKHNEIRAGEGVGTWPFLIHATHHPALLENIAAEKANTSLLGHDYFSSQSLLLIDIGNNLIRGMRPKDRVAIFVLRERSFPQGPTWFFP